MYVRGDDPEPTGPIFTQRKRCWRLRKMHDVAGPWGRDPVFEFRNPGPIRITVRKDASKSPPRLALHGHRSGYGAVRHS